MLVGMRHTALPVLGFVVLVMVTAACSESAAGTADYRGRDYSKQGDYENAIKEFDKAIRLGDMKRTWASKPFYVAAIYYNRGNAYLNLGQYKHAIQDYDEVLRITEQEHAKAYNNRGNAYYYLEQYQRAIKDYDKAIRIDPQLTKAYFNRGIAYADLGQQEQAERDYAKAKELGYNPYDPEPYGE